MVHRPSGSNYKVAVQDIGSGVTNILTPTSLDESPASSPNGQMVVYATREANRGLLSIMSLDGRFRMAYQVNKVKFVNQLGHRNKHLHDLFNNNFLMKHHK